MSWTLRLRCISIGQTALSGFPIGSYLVVLGTLVETREYSTGLGRDNSLFIIISRKFPNRFDGIEPHDGDELNFVRDVTPEELNASIAADVTAADTDEYFLFEKILICIGISIISVAVPDSGNHSELPFCEITVSNDYMMIYAGG